jgi:iron(III) transport system ATP-binding protein
MNQQTQTQTDIAMPILPGSDRATLDPQGDQAPLSPKHRLCLDGLTKTYPGGSSPAMQDVSFCVAAGELFALVGPSGCGKSTTLRVAAGLERADAGVVRHNGEACQDEKTFIPPERRGIGLVFQDYALFPHLNVVENVAYGLRKMSRSDKRKRAEAALERVGMAGLGGRPVQQLSGGQQQRVALARAMAPGTDVVLLDEPMSNLDAELKASVRHELKQLVHETELAVVLVTHDHEQAMSTADRLAVMRDGRLLQVGSPESIYRRPTTAFVAQFLGRTNLIAGDAAGQVANTPLGMIELDRNASGPVRLSIRPEHLTLDFSPAPSQALTVTSREFKGHDMTYTVQLHSQQLQVQTDAGCLARVGDRVRLKPTAAAIVVEDDVPAATATG